MFLLFVFSLQLYCTSTVLKRMLLDVVNRAKRGPGTLELSLFNAPSKMNIMLLLQFTI